MNDPLILIAGLSALVVLIGLALLLWQIQRLRMRRGTLEERLAGRDTELAATCERLVNLEGENRRLQEENQQRREELARLKTSLDHERRQFEEKMALLNDSREQLTVTFKNIANEIFEDKTRKFTTTSKEALAHVLNPLQERIGRFEKRVEETYDKEAKERFSLAREIKNLQELNARISEDAVNLTNALKGDNKAQGNWGEFVLESILEKSGLVKGREYQVQVSLKAEDGSKSQPDVVVHLPESRDIIIDSKVSLKAWDEYTSCEVGEQKAALLKQHINSIRMHVRGLSAKDYQHLHGINTLDYVFLFMPIESAYSEATREDPELLQFAYDRNIILVGPSTLLTALKMVQNLWRLAQQNQNANEIAAQAGRLYDKFVNFVKDLEEVGARIDASRKSYDKAFNKLSSGQGNLIRRTEKLKDLGARTSKQQDRKLLGDALDTDLDSEEEDVDAKAAPSKDKREALVDANGETSDELEDETR